MAMVINSNIQSLNAQRNLTLSQGEQSQAMERLTSGKRINSAADDAAGLSIANRMTSQVRGLDQAIRNANDGISMIQTAEGALDETTNILQRMRELSIQSANGTYDSGNRATLNAEVQQLVEEIDRISETTKFNGLKILDGTLGQVDLQAGADANETISLEIGAMDSASLGGVSADVVGVALSSLDFTSSTITNDSVTATTTSFNLEINGQSAGDLSTLGNLDGSVDGKGIQDLVDHLNNAIEGVEAAAYVEAEAASTGTGILLAGESLQIDLVRGDGSDASFIVTGTSSLEELASEITKATDGEVVASIQKDENGLDVMVLNAEGATSITTTETMTGTNDSASGITDSTYNAALTLTDTNSDNGDDVTISLTSVGTTGETTTAGGTRQLALQSIGLDTRTENTLSSGVDGSGAALADGEMLINGVEIGVSAGATTAQNVDAINLKSNETGVIASATGDIITLTSGDGSEIAVEYTTGAAGEAKTGIQATNYSEYASGSVANLDISTAAGAQKAIGIIDKALEEINATRGDLGAVNNRLDFTVNNLSNVSENVAAARSRIEDADFAKESANLSRAQVLQQAGTAMLAQANAAPQQVLSLLQ